MEWPITNFSSAILITRELVRRVNIVLGKKGTWNESVPLAPFFVLMVVSSSFTVLPGKGVI